MNGAELKSIRKQHGNLSQSEIASRLGLKLRTYQNYEHTGKMPLSIEKLIAYEFNMQDQNIEKPNVDLVKVSESSNIDESLEAVLSEAKSLPLKDKVIVIEVISAILYRNTITKIHNDNKF